MTELPIPAGEMIFEYSASDAGELAGSICDAIPEGTFRTAMFLPEMNVHQPENPDVPCVRTAWSLAKSISGSQLIRPVLDHLRANLVRKTDTKIVFLNRQNRIAVMKADAMERSDAESIMKRFLCLYHAGMRKPLPFFPKTSYAYFSESDERKKAGAAESCWSGGYGDSKGEVEKFGVFFGTELQISDDFKRLAEAFFGAVVFHQEKSAGSGKGKRK